MPLERDDPRSRLLFAFVVSPAVAPLVFILLIMAIPDALGRHGVDLPAYATVLTIGGPLAYATALFAGIPIYFLLRATRLLNLGGVLAGGAIAGALLPGVLMSRNQLSDYAFAAGLGICSAAVFWWLGVRQPTRRGTIA